MKKIIHAIAVVVAASLVAACGAQDEPEVFGQVTQDMPGGFQLPMFTEATPAYAVFPKGSSMDSNLKRVRQLGAVTAAAPLKVTQVSIEGPNGKVPLQLGATPPLKFRPVAPDPTRDADFVWTTLIAGQAVVTYQAAEELGIEGAGPLGIPGLGGIRVGAFAENGVPTNFADVLVSNHVIEKMPGEPIDMIVNGAAEDTDHEQLRRDLSAAVPKAKLLPLEQVVSDDAITADAAPDPVAQGTAEAGLGGKMTFTILEDGW